MHAHNKYMCICIYADDIWMCIRTMTCTIKKNMKNYNKNYIFKIGICFISPCIMCIFWYMFYVFLNFFISYFNVDMHHVELFFHILYSHSVNEKVWILEIKNLSAVRKSATSAVFTLKTFLERYCLFNIRILFLFSL